MVRNHEVGTGLPKWYFGGRSGGGDIVAGVDAGEHVDGGVVRSDEVAERSKDLRARLDRGESQERRSVTTGAIGSDALKESEDQEGRHPADEVLRD